MPLRARRERPRESRSTEKGNELPPPHSTPSQQSRCQDTTSNQRTPHRFVALHCKRIYDGGCGSRTVLLGSLPSLKSVSALPPIPGMSAMDRSTYAWCHNRTKTPKLLRASRVNMSHLFGPLDT